MKRSLLIFIGLALMFPMLSSAQLRVAVIGGPHKASVVESNNIPGWDSATKPGYGSRTGFNLGVLIDVPLNASNNWFFQPGIIYHGKGRTFSKSFDTAAIPVPDTSSVSLKFSPNYIDLPLNIAYKFRLGTKAAFLISAGPYVSFFYNGKEKAENRLFPSGKYETREKNIEVGNETGKVKTLDIGVNARAGLELGPVLVTGFYSRGFSNFSRQEYDSKLQHQVLGASFGFYLNRPAAIVKKPKDSDGDGILDLQDECPNDAGVALTNGCPDRDNDGIADKNDKCPDIAGMARYQGCAIPDSDKDGINDENDKCPNAPGLPEFNGCPIPDRDKDGVNDKIDRCPDQPGSPLNNGCPEIRKEVIEKIDIAAKRILFETGSDKLKASSYAAIDEVVALMTQDTTLRLTISGHTDNVGDDEKNQALSERRANAVKTAVIEKGIAAGRVMAVGFGESRPIASNDSEEGRSENRRVELKLENN